MRVGCVGYTWIILVMVRIKDVMVVQTGYCEDKCSIDVCIVMIVVLNQKINKKYNSDKNQNHFMALDLVSTSPIVN